VCTCAPALQVIDTGLLEGVGLPNSSADELRDALKAQVWVLGSAACC
jgi:hypothetical protein